MRKEIKNALIIFIGGILMVFGLYYSYLFKASYFVLILGVLIFVYGLIIDSK